MSDTDPELIVLLKKIRYDLTDFQGKVTEALRQAAALNLEPPVKYDCPTCGVYHASQRRLDEHLYNQHDGPLPAAYIAAEALADEEDAA